jgi:hypothetical protein
MNKVEERPAHEFLAGVAEEGFPGGIELMEAAIESCKAAQIARQSVKAFEILLRPEPPRDVESRAKCKD